VPNKRVFKSKKKLSGARATYRPWKEWEIGDLIIGKYRGQKEDNYEKPNWLFEVLDAQFSDGRAAKKLIGQTIGLNSNGQLNKAMNSGLEKGSIEEGETILQVMYNGTSEIEKGKYAGKDAHLVEVDIVEEDDGSEEDADSEDGGEDDAGDDL
jgi:hypothetical protein